MDPDDALDENKRSALWDWPGDPYSSPVWERRDGVFPLDLTTSEVYTDEAPVPVRVRPWGFGTLIYVGGHFPIRVDRWLRRLGDPPTPAVPLGDRLIDPEEP